MNINQITGGSGTIINSLQDAKQAPYPVAANPSESLPTQDAKPLTAVSASTLKKSVDEINHFLQSSNGVNLNIDQSSGKVVVQIIDRETNAVIRQIPSAEVLSMARDLDGKKGLLLNDQA